MTSLIKTFGEDHARAVWDAGLAAISQIGDIIDDEGIECRFAWVPGYLHAPLAVSDQSDSRRTLELEAEAASRLGFDVRVIDNAPLIARPAVEIDHQARFHPAPYLLPAGEQRSTATAVRSMNSRRSTRWSQIHWWSCSGGYRVKADYLVVATHNPIVGKSSFLGATMLQTKLALYTSYVVSGRVASGVVPDALFWDTGDPYHYLRIDRAEDYDEVIYGGEDHKTGQAGDGASRFAALEGALVRLVPNITLTNRWAGQVIETNDGLPFIGETSSAPVCRHGFQRQRHHVRHAGRDDGARPDWWSHESLGGIV